MVYNNYSSYNPNITIRPSTTRAQDLDFTDSYNVYYLASQQNRLRIYIYYVCTTSAAAMLRNTRNGYILLEYRCV